MKRKSQLIILTIVIFSLGVGACAKQNSHTAHQAEVKQPVQSADAHNHAPQPPKARVPAYQTAESAKNLPPTLSPDLFNGTVRAAYAAVKEIPETIAQLPCYCHCDKSFGHKSLHTCFTDDHGANCGICMNSALTAYRLQKEQKLAPDQIREKLIAQYSQYPSTGH